MIATIDRLMALSQRLLEAERLSEREPVYVALDLNEVHMLVRMIDSYIPEVEAYTSAPHAEESY